MKNQTALLRLAPPQKLVLHPQYGQYLDGQKIFPINVEISPCGICQASCSFCWYANTGELGSHRNVHLDEAVLLDLLCECRDMGVKSITWTGGGEPGLYKNIAEAVRLTRQLGLDQGMFTNALSMPRYDPSLLEWIRVTMTDKPYKPECIEPLRAARTLSFAFNYAGPKDDVYLLQTLKLAEEVKADYVQLRPALACHGKTVDIKPPQFTHPLLHVTDYKFEDARHPHGYRTCEAYHFVPFVWEDGNVDVCSYMRKHEGYTLGNLYKQSFTEIMRDAPQSVPVHEQCQVCCKPHEINKAIHAGRELEDVNFP